MVDISHYDLVVVMAFIAGGLVVGFGVLGKIVGDIHRQNQETQRMTRAVAGLVIQEIVKLRR